MKNKPYTMPLFSKEINIHELTAEIHGCLKSLAFIAEQQAVLRPSLNASDWAALMRSVAGQMQMLTTMLDAKKDKALMQIID